MARKYSARQLFFVNKARKARRLGTMQASVAAKKAAGKVPIDPDQAAINIHAFDVAYGAARAAAPAAKPLETAEEKAARQIAQFAATRAKYAKKA